MTKYLSERINFMVYVISIGGKPLMPCTPVIARLLLKQGKAKCIKRTPFTIKLLYETARYTQELALGIDTGSSKVGSAVVNEKNEVVYLSQIEIRNKSHQKNKGGDCSGRDKQCGRQLFARSGNYKILCAKAPGRFAARCRQLANKDSRMVYSEKGFFG